MANTLRLWILYALIVTLGVLALHAFPTLVEHPLTVLAFLLLIGGAEIHSLTRCSIPYFHWLFYSKTTVVNELRAILLTYLLFLIASITVNIILKSNAFIILTALIFPLAAGAIAFAHEFARYARKHKFYRK